ncbi:MAG: hypothetical protein B7733_19220 [Myxococcales bacterium FL481]|nr:MAG: hypothetical protein B7733_19220 [Myxococcales bacterium FL481]
MTEHVRRVNSPFCEPTPSGRPDARRPGTSRARTNARRRMRRLRVSLFLAANLTWWAAACSSTKTPSRTAAPTPTPVSFTPAQRERIAAVQGEVRSASMRYGLDPSLINGVIWVESRFQTTARSPAGARGLMQLMPATARELARQMGERRARPYDPEFNIHAGSFYLAKLIARYDGDVRVALAAYNAGPGNVGRWLRAGKPMPDYSRRYVGKVEIARARFVGSAQPSRTSPATRAQPVDAGSPRPGSVHPSRRSPAPRTQPTDSRSPRPGSVHPSRRSPSPRPQPTDSRSPRPGSVHPSRQSPSPRPQPTDSRSPRPGSVHPSRQSPAPSSSRRVASPPPPTAPKAGLGVLPNVDE